MSTIEERIRKLEEKLKQEKARKLKIEARKKAIEKRHTRAEDTRRKILVGALILEAMDRDPDTRQRMIARLNSYLTRPGDRALFDLPINTAGDPARIK